MSTGYRRPKGKNAFEQYASASREAHPLEVDYRSLKIGDSVRLRFLDLTEDSTVALEAREVKILNPQNQSFMNIKVEIPLGEDGKPLPEVKELVDHNQTPVLAGKSVRIYRCPVWVYHIVKEKEIIDVDGLRYLEFTQGLRDSLEELRSFQNGVGEFNEETGRPDYDVDLRIIKGEGSISKNYVFDVVYLDAKTKKPHENFGVEAEEVLEEVMGEIDSAWDEVQDAIHTRTTLDALTKRVAPPKSNDKQSVSSRPSAGRSSRHAVEEEEERKGSSEDEEDPPSGEPTRPSRRYGRRN
jgi:hypothetical protein